MTWRPVAALAGALAIGAIVAVIPPELSLLAAAFSAALAFVVALVIAALLLALAAGGRALARRPARPPASWVAIALVIGAAVVFPVNAGFTTEPRSEGSCNGVLPLGELVQNRLAGDDHATFYYVAGCED
jgi:hypothetical protein